VQGLVVGVVRALVAFQMVRVREAVAVHELEILQRFRLRQHLRHPADRHHLVLGSGLEPLKQ
jgi:hypothetical protein